MEHAERRVLEIVGQLDELVAEAQIRLVGAVLVHRVLPGDARQRKLDVIAAGLPDRLDDLLGHRDDILLVDIAHFHIELRELRLAVSAEVLIAIATCELIVAFDAADHEQLLEQLGALRQRIPRTRHQTGRHKEVASAFRGGLDEGRGLHLGEVHVFQRVARSLRHVGTQLQVALHLRTTQIKIPVLQAHVLARQLVLGLVLERSGHLERQGVGLGEHLEILDDDLDLAGGQMRVLVALRAQAHLAGDLDDELAAQRAGDLLVIDDDLHETGVVTQIDERHTAVVATTVDPTGERDLLPDERLGHFRGVMCSVSRLAHASSILVKSSEIGGKPGFPSISVCLQVDSLPGIYSIRLPRLGISRGLITSDDVLDLVALGFAVLARRCREPHVRDAQLVGVLDLLAEFRGGRRNVGRNAAGTQLVGDCVGGRAIILIPYGDHDRSRGNPRGVRASGMQHVGHQTGQTDGQADARVTFAALRCEIVVPAARADRTERIGAVKEGLVHGTGVIIQTAGDFEVGDHRARADTCRLVDDHRQRIEPLASQSVRLAVSADAMLSAQGVELLGKFLAVRRRQFGKLKAGTRLCLIRAAAFNQKTSDLIGANLVELVDFAQHAFDIRQAKSAVETFGQLTIIRVDSRLRQTEFAQLFQCTDHDQRQFDLIMLRQVTVADHVDIGLHELAEPALLRTFAAPDLLDLPTFEREGQRAGMLDDIPAQRNRQIEMQPETIFNRRVGFMADFLQTRQQVDLLAGLAFFQQTRASFNGTRLDTDEAIELENPTERVNNTLLHNTFRGEPLWKS